MTRGGWKGALLALAAAGGALGAGERLEVRLGRPDVGQGAASRALRVQLLEADGGARIAPASVGVRLRSATATGELATSASPFVTWSAVWSGAIPAGASQTPALYYRDSALGQATLTADSDAGVLPGSAVVELVPLFLSSDFESGTKSISDTPPGEFNDGYSASDSGISVLAAARHRGTYGLRHTDFDNRAGANDQGALVFQSARVASASACYVRFWLRYGTLNDLGTLTFGQLTTDTANNTSMIDAILHLPGGTLTLEGSQNGGPFGSVPATGTLDAGTWNLVELAVDGLNGGITAGRRRLWVNRQLVATATGLNFSSAAWTPVGLGIGQPWSDDRRFQGTLDYDDVRLSRAPHGSGLQVAQVDGGVPGCEAFEVTLLDSLGAPAPAPYDVSLVLFPFPTVELYPTPDCRGAAPLVLATSSSSVRGYAHSDTAVTSLLVVSHLDFMSGAGALVLTGGPVPDAGPVLPDGGVLLPDGGVLLPDGGVLLPDGGVPALEPLRLRVGCEGALQPPLLLALAGLALLLRGRRAPRAARPHPGRSAPPPG